MLAISFAIFGYLDIWIFGFSVVAFSGEAGSFSVMFIFWGKSVLFQARSRRTEGSGGRVARAVVISGRMRLRTKERVELRQQVESSELL